MSPPLTFAAFRLHSLKVNLEIKFVHVTFACFSTMRIFLSSAPRHTYTLCSSVLRYAPRTSFRGSYVSYYKSLFCRFLARHIYSCVRRSFFLTWYHFLPRYAYVLFTAYANPVLYVFCGLYIYAVQSTLIMYLTPWFSFSLVWLRIMFFLLSFLFPPCS